MRCATHWHAFVSGCHRLTPANTRATIKDMVEDRRQVGFRLPEPLVQQIDAYALELGKSTGLTVSRTDAIRLLLEKGLQAAKAERKRK